MSNIQDFSPLWGEWKIMEPKLGEGSFGTVWKVYKNDPALGTVYAAVKHISIPKDEQEINTLLDEGIISSHQTARQYYDSLRTSIAQEISAMHKLRGYTNLVSYEDHLIIPKPDGIGYDLFLRMELLTPLSERVKRGMTVEEIVKLGIDIATAIEVLNKHGYVHRDIKPQNVFVNEIGNYELGDFGTVRDLRRAVTMSQKGTYNYMAPEIYKGQSADWTVDIYSLGIMLYRYLNGNRLPFLPVTGEITAETSEQAFMKRMSGVPLPSPAYADEKLGAIILKACAYDPKNRYQSGTELKNTLAAYLANRLREKSDTPEDDNTIPAFPLENIPNQLNTPSSRLPERNLYDGKNNRKKEYTEPSEMSRSRVSRRKTNKQKKKKTVNLYILLIVFLAAVIGFGLFNWLSGHGKENRQTASPSADPTEAYSPTSNLPIVTVLPTQYITALPTVAPSPALTETPTAKPTQVPTEAPTPEPTAAPTAEPTPIPTEAPTPEPTAAPTAEPTPIPTEAPTAQPTAAPTATPIIGSNGLLGFDDQSITSLRADCKKLLEEASSDSFDNQWNRIIDFPIAFDFEKVQQIAEHSSVLELLTAFGYDESWKVFLLSDRGDIINGMVKEIENAVFSIDNMDILCLSLVKDGIKYSFYYENNKMISFCCAISMNEKTQDSLSFYYEAPYIEFTYLDSYINGNENEQYQILLSILEQRTDDKKFRYIFEYNQQDGLLSDFRKEYTKPKEPAPTEFVPKSTRIITHYVDITGKTIANDTERQLIGEGVWTIAPEHPDLLHNYDIESPKQYFVIIDKNGASKSEISFVYREKGSSIQEVTSDQNSQEPITAVESFALISKNTVNIRSGPSTKDRVVLQVGPDTTLIGSELVTSSDGLKWYKVK